MPREVFSGQNVNACVTLHNVKRLPTEVAVHLKILGETHTTIQTVETGRRFKQKYFKCCGESLFFYFVTKTMELVTHLYQI